MSIWYIRFWLSTSFFLLSGISLPDWAISPPLAWMQLNTGKRAARESSSLVSSWHHSIQVLFHIQLCQWGVFAISCIICYLNIDLFCLCYSYLYFHDNFNCRDMIVFFVKYWSNCKPIMPYSQCSSEENWTIFLFFFRNKFLF